VSYDDPFDVPEKRPAWSWAESGSEIGYTVEFDVMDKPRMAQQRDFDTGDPAYWDEDQTQPKMAAVTDVQVDGNDYALWAPKPSALFNAIVKAKKEADAAIDAGGKLKVKITEYKCSNGHDKSELKQRSGEWVCGKCKRKAQRLFAAKYTPAKPVVDEFDDDSTPPF
jgi:hypothetical protein